MTEPVLCECKHDPEEHRPKAAGRCHGLDSYGIGCKCPSYEELDDSDGDELPVDAARMAERPPRLVPLRKDYP